MADEKSDLAPIGEDSRITTLDERLMAARKREDERVNKPAPDGSDANYRLGNRVLAELVGGMVGGAFLGWVIDQFAKTSPWGLLVMLFVGVGVAFRNIIRISNRRPE
ncbi:AtpZ/AtpI family protein [Novosphingobium sp. KCTC 2891]|uniref:AtpZ/AtpI family protein n=1 Tax=Novosphingobium sp. KCTC 2891 TaxID=2989730 RepID=UPI002221BA7F|nr:AtpZ/AtpI family protein [Novosphingobium sp. KCTC 2891]MCW1384448.1 AtpZ/AtpI family protein [Novosphingobium sp. KCTC 2891]